MQVNNSATDEQEQIEEIRLEREEFKRGTEDSVKKDTDEEMSKK